MPKVSRLEVIQTGARRRWTVEEKRRIVAESGRGTRQVSATARRYGLSTGQLFTWRRLARKGRLGGNAEPVSFAEAVIADGGAGTVALPPAAGAYGRLEIVLADGLRVIVEQAVDVFVSEVFGTHRKQIIRLVISEGPRFPAIAEFYYREVLSRAMAAVRAFLQRAHQRGELADDTIVRYPQLIAAPAILAIAICVRVDLLRLSSRLEH